MKINRRDKGKDKIRKKIVENKVGTRREPGELGENKERTLIEIEEN